MPQSPIEEFEQRQVSNLLDAVRYLNVNCLLTKVTDPGARLWLCTTLLGMASLFHDESKAPDNTPSEEPANEA